MLLTHEVHLRSIEASDGKDDVLWDRTRGLVPSHRVSHLICKGLLHFEAVHLICCVVSIVQKVIGGLPCDKAFPRYLRRDYLGPRIRIDQPWRALSPADKDGDSCDVPIIVGEVHLGCDRCEEPDGRVHVWDRCYWSHTHHQPHLHSKNHFHANAV